MLLSVEVKYQAGANDKSRMEHKTASLRDTVRRSLSRIGEKDEIQPNNFTEKR